MAAPRPLPRAYSSRYAPLHPVNTQSLDAAAINNEDDDGDNDTLGSDGQSIIGVSLGQQQAHLASPTATGAERLAAYSNNPDADEVIGKADYTDGQTDEPDVQSSDSDQDEDPQAATQSGASLTSQPKDDAKTRARDALPAPWRVNTNDAWVAVQRRDSRNASRVRPRAASLLDSNKEPASWKKFIPTLPKVSMPRIMVSKSSLSNQSSSSTKATESVPSLREEPSTTSSVGKEEVEDISTRDFQDAASTGTYRSIISPKGTNEDLGQRPPLLRRTTSDGSLYLQRALSHASSLGDDDRWADVHEQVNSRMKAIKDTLADSNLRLPRPSMPDISLPKMSSSWLDIDTTRFKSRGLLNAKNDRQSSPRSLPPNARDGNGSRETRRDTVREASPPPGMTKTSAVTHPQFTRALRKTKGDLVVLGGYRGSVLRSAEPPHRQVWVPVKVGLNIRKVDLEVGLSHEDELNAEEKIIPSGMLKNIGPVDISRRLFKRFSTSKNAMDGSLRIWDYGYDWRLSPHLLSAQLIQFLEGLECNAPNTPPEDRGATVIAHSLGGLVTRHAVNKRPELFRGVVYAGTPQNCVNILGPLRNGDDVLLSSKVLTAQVNFSMRSSFALLPLDGKCFFNSKTQERYDIDFFDPKVWEDWHLSPVINRPLPPAPQPTSSGPIDGLVSSMSSVLPSLSKRRESSPRPPNAATLDPTDTSGGGAHNRAIVPQMGNRGDPAVQHMESPETNISTAVDIPKPVAVEYLTRTLREVKQFKQELVHNPQTEEKGLYPPCAVIYGKSVPTVYGARVDSREGIKRSDAYDNLAFASGDGVVLARAAQLPPGYKVSRGGCVSSERGHISLLGDLEAVGQCLNAIRVEKRLRKHGKSIAREPRIDEIEQKVVA